MSQSINWFPGHMAKSLREIKEQVKAVDLIVETADARIPASSRNPELESILGSKPHLLVLTKPDLADPVVTERWLAAARAKGMSAMSCNTLKPKEVKAVSQAIVDLASPAVNRQIERGLKGRWPKAMVVGIPNTGKTTLIKQLSGRFGAKTENRPGVTRSVSWIRSSENQLELLDTPGVLWPDLGHERSRIHLAVTGAIKDSVLDLEEIAYRSFIELLELYPVLMHTRYKLDEEDLEALSQDLWLVYETAARNMGCLRAGKKIDSERFARLFITDLREGRIGRVSLERPDGT